MEKEEIQTRQGDLVESEASKQVRKTNFIPNPLPGPKPHVKRTMSYDYDIPADKMHFDIENPQKNYYDYD